MDFLTNDRIAIMEEDALAEKGVKIVAAAMTDYDDDMAFEDECVDVAFDIGREKQQRSVGKFLVLMVGIPVGVLLGLAVAWWSVSAWWNIICSL